MHRSRIVTVLYCLTGAAAALLTWASQTLLGETTFLKGIDPAYSITKTNLGDGWITLICFCAIIAIAAAGRRSQPMNLRKIVVIRVIAFLSLAVSGYHIFTILLLPKAATADDLQMKVAPGLGLYLTVLVSLMLLLLPIKYRATAAEKRDNASNKKPLH